ncbi:MAG: IS1380 family transposase [Solirubrobacteraceae bacterium]
MHDGRSVAVKVTSDGAGLVSHAGTALVAQVADKVGLTAALSLRLAAIKARRRGHDPGRVIRDLAVMLVDGGECVSDLGAVREQAALFGTVASDSTAFRMIDRIASTPGLLDALRQAHARARARFWELDGTPVRLTLDPEHHPHARHVDATLITAHSEKEKAAGNYKGGYGFHPLQVYLDETREALGGLLRPGNAGSNTADDHKAVLDRALAQIPPECLERLEILVRSDSAGATHGLVDYCREANMRFSVGYELSEQVRSAILQIPEDAWVPALDQDGSPRTNGEVAEVTEMVDLSAWPERCRLIVRRERPHPGAQLSFTDHNGYRFQAILTDQSEADIAVLECRHRQHAHVEDRIRDDKDTGLAKFPFKEFALNEVWLEIVMLAHDLIVWTQALVLDGELAKAEPKRLRYRLLHVAARLAFSGRRAKLHLQDTWPWADQLRAAFQKLETLAVASG